MSQVLRAAQTFIDERGALPRSALDWGRQRNHDGRFPAWPTIRKVGFHSMEDLADALGTTTNSGRWGRARVVLGLRLYAAEKGPIPANSAAYHQTAKGDRRFPSFYGVLKFFPNFEDAAVAAGVPFVRRVWDWTKEEEDFLLMFAGTCPRKELADCLARHTDLAIKRRLYELETTCRSAQGWWTIHRLTRALGCTYEPIRLLERRGAVITKRVSHFRYVDPADLPDWLCSQGTAELRAAALSQWRRRLAELVGGRAMSRRNGTAIKLARLKRQRGA